MLCYSFLEKLFPHVIESHPGLVVYYLELVRPFGKHRYLPCRKKLYDILMYVYDANKEDCEGHASQFGCAHALTLGITRLSQLLSR